LAFLVYQHRKARLEVSRHAYCRSPVDAILAEYLPLPLLRFEAFVPLLTLRDGQFAHLRLGDRRSTQFLFAARRRRDKRRQQREQARLEFHGYPNGEWSDRMIHRSMISYLSFQRVTERSTWHRLWTAAPRRCWDIEVPLRASARAS